MSLRGRLLLVIILLNLGVLGIVQGASALFQNRVLRDYRSTYERHLQAVLADAYSYQRKQDPRRVLRLLEPDSSIGRFFRDVLVTNGSRPTDPGSVNVNLMGASHRDPEFPLDRIREGITVAMNTGELVEESGGFCVPIRVDGSVEAGAWYLPLLTPMSQTPFVVFAVPVIISTLVFGLLAFYTISRSLDRPLRSLGRAASRVGAGEFSVRVERVPRTPELNVLVDAFNGMASRIEGHTEDLEREVRRATEEARRKERALVVSGRLASMGTLAAGIAHEINNPIGGMLNAAHRLKSREGLSDRDKLYLDLILEGLDRVSSTARRVLDFSPRQVEPVPFSLADAVDAASALVEHRVAREGVALRISIPDDLPPIVGDRHEIQQVLLNLFLNSLDVLVGRDDPWIAVMACRQESMVRLLVEDNGPGIETELIDRVLDPFFSAKDRPDATGLGMFISYSIIKNHGGEMEVDSAPDKGFRVTIRMPVRAAS